MSAAAPREAGAPLAAPPLVVDLDGTLIRTDMLHETALQVLRDRPWDVLRIPLWLARGKAVLKRCLADRVTFDPRLLPYNSELLGWLRCQRAEGRRLILCTASDRSIAVAIADHLKVFDEVMASDGETNLAGECKADALIQRFGKGGFDYAGNAPADLAIWERARRAVVVNASTGVAGKVAACCEVEQVFTASAPGFTTWRQVLRAHQWLKNLLLFVPLVAAHELTSLEAWCSLVPAFLSFCLGASAVYVTNDLLDLESDRLHPHKRNRPFASGRVPPWTGVALAPALLGASLGLAMLAGDAFIGWLAAYFALTCAYSWRLKRIMLVDLLALAMLYTLRIVAGAAAARIDLSFWLLAFSIFLFLSLAFVKRYAELKLHLLSGLQEAHGRSYCTNDAPLIETLGVASGYASVMVLALYLNSEAVLRLYRAPAVVWGAVPVMLFWISWIWMQAHRGRMHDDPLVFAVTDKASLVAGAAFAAVLALGTAGWPW